MTIASSHIDTGAFSRRAFLQTLSSVGLGLVALPLAGRTAAAAEEVSVLTWSTYNDPKLFPDYLKTHGQPTMGFFGDEQEVLNKLRAGHVVDLAHPCASSIMRFRNSDVLKPFDPSRLKHVQDMWPELVDLPGTVDSAGRWFIPFDWGNSSIIYRTDLVDAKDPSWSLIYTDERYKGRVAMYDSGEPAVQIAALILGHKNIFTLSDEQLKDCAKVLRTQRDSVRFYWSDQTNAEQALASGEVVAAYGWNDGAYRLKKQGVPVEFMNPKEGMLTWVCGLVMYKNPPHEDLAYDFANAFTAAEAGGHLLNTQGVGHANKKAFDLASAETLASLGFSNPTELMKRSNFLEEMAEDRRSKYNETFDNIKAGG